MPKGTPRNWTLEELQTIWEFDGDNGQTSVSAAARGLGISHSHWYGIRSRLQDAGSPEVLFAEMEDAKTRRYNRASNGKARVVVKRPDSIADALTRVYLLRVSGAGRGGGYEQFTVTVPPIVAAAFVAEHGWEVMWEPREDGILMKPIPRVPMPEIPSWLSKEAAA